MSVKGEMPSVQRIARVVLTRCNKDEEEGNPRGVSDADTVDLASIAGTDATDGELSTREGESSDTGSTIANSSKKRKRGRLPIDEEANLRRKARLVEEAQEAQDEKKIRVLRDPTIEAPLSINRRRLEIKAKEEIRHLPKRAIPAAIITEIKAIDKVAQTSRSLSGPYQGA